VVTRSGLISLVIGQLEKGHLRLVANIGLGQSEARFQDQFLILMAIKYGVIGLGSVSLMFNLERGTVNQIASKLKAR